MGQTRGRKPACVDAIAQGLMSGRRHTAKGIAFKGQCERQSLKAKRLIGLDEVIRGRKVITIRSVWSLIEWHRLLLNMPIKHIIIHRL